MTKDKVLAILKNTDEFVSGEKISSEIGVSRMAVSNAVAALREEGYEIDSVTRRGYRLMASPDRLTEGEVHSYLTKERSSNVICVDCTDSTNRQLKEMALDGASTGTVLIANEQTGGRGRLGRSFVSPKDKGVYLSILLRPECSPTDTSTITAWTAVAVSNAIKEAYGLDTEIKWVNDVYCAGKKICGILTEMAVEGESGHISYVVIGIGINVNHESEDFPEELRCKAGSLRMVAGSVLQRAKVAACLINELDKLAEGFPEKKEEYLSQYRRLCFNIGQEVYVNQGDSCSRAKVIDIENDFSIKLEYPDGTVRSMSSGEISIRSNELF